MSRIIATIVVILSSFALNFTSAIPFASCYFPAPSLLLVSIASSLPYATAAKTSNDRKTSKKKTHYEVLQVPQDASLQDIKKAYRKLAVQHHPDRNPGHEEEATVRFREVSEAYEILSDEKSRKQYDNMLKYGGFDTAGSDGSGVKFNWSTGGGGSRGGSEFKHRDPFAQFNDVFRNDPFFAEARKSMDDLFDKHFSSFGSEANKERAGETVGGGIWGTLKKFMPDINIQTTVTTGGRASTTTRSYSNRGSGSGGGSTYTSRSTRTTIENGQRVTIQSLEKDGNRIEEKYIGDKLIERKINGLKQDIGRIGQGEF